MADLNDAYEPGYQLPTELPRPEEMSPREKALRDMFVSEYLVDFDEVRAAQRCGFAHQFAVEYARKFMEEAYVQQRINQVKYTKLDERAEEEYNHARIKAALMAEAHYKGPGSSHSGRVAALGKLMSVYGMEAPKKIDATVQHRGGVMAVPGIANLDDWEQQASASQDQLAEHARDV